MNFVRFVKTPRVTQSPTPTTPKKTSYFSSNKTSDRTLSMILTITSDFTPFAGQTSLSCTLFSSPDGKLLAKKQLEWTGSTRELPVDFPLPSKAKSGKIVVRHLVNSGWTSNQALGEYLASNGTHIVGLASSDVELDVVGGKTAGLVYRRFMLPRGPVTIAEDAGET